MFICKQQINLITQFFIDITLQKILESDRSRTFWTITPKQEFCQAWNLQWNVTN